MGSQWKLFPISKASGMVRNPSPGVSDLPSRVENLLPDRAGAWRPWGKRVSVNSLPAGWQIFHTHPNGVNCFTQGGDRTKTRLLGPDYSTRVEDHYPAYCSKPVVVPGAGWVTPYVAASVQTTWQASAIANLWNAQKGASSVTLASGGGTEIDTVLINGTNLTIYVTEVTGGSYNANDVVVFWVLYWVDTPVGWVLTALQSTRKTVVGNGVGLRLDFGSSFVFPDYGEEIWILVNSSVVGGVYHDHSNALIARINKTEGVTTYCDGSVQTWGPITIWNENNIVGTAITDSYFWGWNYMSYLGGNRPPKPLLTADNHALDPKTTVIHKQRLFTVVRKSQTQKSLLIWSEPDRIGWFRTESVIPLDNTSGASQVTGLGSASFGLMIFFPDGAWVLSGDYSTLGGTRFEKYPSPIGHDPGAITPPVSWGGGVFTVWQGSLWWASAGRAEHVGQPIYDPMDPVVGAWLDSDLNDIAVKTANNRLLRFDPETKNWLSHGTTTESVVLVPGNDGAVHLHNASTYELARLSRPSTSTAADSAVIEWTDLDMGDPTTLKQFRSVFVRFSADPPDPTLLVLSGEIDHQPFTAPAPDRVREGYYRFVLPSSLTGSRLTLRLSFAPGTTHLTSSMLRVPVVVEWREAYRQ